MTWSIEDGHVTWSIKSGERTKVLWRIHKLGSKKGDTWVGAGETGPIEATCLGTTKLQVKAGEFKDVHHHRFVGKAKDEGNFDFYVVPKVGLLKVLMEVEGEKLLLELKEFRPGK